MNLVSRWVLAFNNIVLPWTFVNLLFVLLNLEN